MTEAPLNIVPTLPGPGTWGVTHGSGFLGDMIRYVEQAESRSTRKNPRTTRPRGPSAAPMFS